MWRRTATGPEAPPFGMGIEAFGIGPASRFATEHPALRLKCKPRVKSTASAGLFFTFPAAKQALDSNPASFDPPATPLACPLLSAGFTGPRKHARRFFAEGL